VDGKNIYISKEIHVIMYVYYPINHKSLTVSIHNAL